MKLGPRSQVSTGEETSHMEFTRIWIPQLIEHPQVVGLIVTNNVDTNTECPQSSLSSRVIRIYNVYILLKFNSLTVTSYREK